MNGDGSKIEFVPHAHITNGRVIIVLNCGVYEAVRINYVVFRIPYNRIRVHDATVNLPDYWSSHTLGMLPVGWRPSQEVSAPLAMAELATTARLSVDSSGIVAVKNMSGTAKPGSRRVYGCLCYAAA